MSNSDHLPDLLRRLLLKNQDSTAEDYPIFEAELIRHRFSRLLDHYHPVEMSGHETPVSPTLPAEGEIRQLLSNGHRELFLENILYHLRRSTKVLPPALIPGVLDWVEQHPGLWIMLYRQHPDLLRFLAATTSTWPWLDRVFQPVENRAPGAPGYYDTLRRKMQLAPGQTSNYIRKIFDDLQPPQQARMISILEIDGSGEALDFVTPLIRHRRQPVRQAALEYSIRQKIPSVYDALWDGWTKYHAHSTNAGDFDWSLVSVPTTWKDLADVAGFTAKPDILLALVDPEDLPIHTPEQLLALPRQPLVQTAIQHRSQNTLVLLGRHMPECLMNPDFTSALSPDSAVALLRQRIPDSAISLDPGGINLLKQVHPFLQEADSQALWAKVVRQWKEWPLSLEDLPLEIVALRIHPNQIKPVWQHPILQESAPILQTFRQILKHRLAFLKKCYR